jgi:hypothetical protein
MEDDEATLGGSSHRLFTEMEDSESSDPDYTPSSPEEDESQPSFTREEFEAEQECQAHDAEYEEYLNRVQQIQKEEIQDASRSMGGCATPHCASSSSCSLLGFPAYGRLCYTLLCVFFFLLAVGLSAWSSRSGAEKSIAASCGSIADAFHFAQKLSAARQVKELAYDPPDYALSSSESNIELIEDLLYGKKDSRPVVMLFVCSKERLGIMRRFMESLHQLYYGRESSKRLMYDFTSGAADMANHIRECHHGLFVVDAKQMLAHFDFMETATEDAVPHINHEGEQVYTTNATFIVTDTIQEQVLRQATSLGTTAPIMEHMKAKYSAQWTKRFGQRIAQIFVF